jgi:hypothetical protein
MEQSDWPSMGYRVVHRSVDKLVENLVGGYESCAVWQAVCHISVVERWPERL